MAFGSPKGRKHRRKHSRKVQRRYSYGDYAGTMHEHRRQAKHLTPEVKGWIREFKKVMGTRGASYGRKCHEALSLLTGAARLYGRQNEERLWSYGHRRGARTGIQKVLRGMERQFYQACVVAPRG